MFLHLGQNKIVFEEDIIGIFDLDITSQSIRTREYLAKSEKKHDVVNITEELPKSFIITGKRGKQTVYISQLASSTLAKRSENGIFESLEIDQ